MEYTNTYTQIKNNIMLRKKYKILSFTDKELDIFTFCNNKTKIILNSPLTEEELNLLVTELNEQDIICECEDISNPEENC